MDNQYILIDGMTIKAEITYTDEGNPKVVLVPPMGCPRLSKEKFKEVMDKINLKGDD